MKIRNVMNVKWVISSAVLLGLFCGLLHGQSLPDVVKPENRDLLNEQAQRFYKVIDPLVDKISDSTVVIKSGEKIVGMGTVTASGIIVKYSELAKESLRSKSKMHMVSKANKSYPVKLLHIYGSYDLAVIDNVGKLPAVDLSKSVTPDVGSFILASSASAEAMALGVVSVKPRSLKEKDRGFLGVVMAMKSPKGGGVMLTHVEPRTAADRAGLLPGDVILTVDGKVVTNMLEMRNFLQQQVPGSKITISYRRGDLVTAGLEVTLGARDDIPQVRRSRMNAMKRMGGKVNEVSEGFPQVLQSDIQVKSHFCGAPVVDLNGAFVGVVVAKASRIKTYIIEGKVLENLLKSKPDR